MVPELDAKALGKAVGLFWSAAVVFLGVSSRFGWGRRWQTLLEDLYPGYDKGITGILIGAAWAFLDGFIDAYVVGRLYNKFAASR
jgi:hypothetical protein